MKTSLTVLFLAYFPSSSIQSFALVGSQKPFLGNSKATRSRIELCPHCSANNQQGDKHGQLQKSTLAFDEYVLEYLRSSDHLTSRNVKKCISSSTTIPQFIGDFYREVSKLIDAQENAPKAVPFRRLYVLAAPSCPDLEDPKVFEDLKEEILKNSVSEVGYKHCGEQFITITSSHPRYAMSSVRYGAVRHAPHPTFIIYAEFKKGGGGQTQQRWPFNQMPTPPAPLALPLRRLSANLISDLLGMKPVEKGDWTPRARSSLEILFSRPSVSSHIDKVPARGSGAVPESSLCVLENVQQWMKTVLQASESTSWSSSNVVRKLGRVQVVEIVRSGRAEDLLADAWDSVAELIESANNAGCAVPEEGDEHKLPCYSSVLVAPEFATYNFGLFSRFANNLGESLELLLPHDNVSVQMFHPEYVSDLSTDIDSSSLRRSPWPAIHIRYDGLRVAKTLDNDTSEMVEVEKEAELLEA